MLQLTARSTEILLQLSVALNCPSRVRQVFVRALDYYYVPRSQTNIRAAKAYIKHEIESFNVSSELPNWLVRVHAVSVLSASASVELSIPSPFSQR